MGNPWKLGIQILTCIVAVMCIVGCEKQVATESDVDWVQSTLASMDAGTRMGQSLCLTVDPVQYFIYPNYRVTTDHLIETYQFGAIYLKTDLDSLKMETREEFNSTKLKDVISQMQQNANVPMIFAADFENGAWYWDTKATRFPYPLALAADNAAVMSYRQAKITAVEAHSQGLHMVFAPFLNTDIDPHRIIDKLSSFGEKTEIAASLGSQYVLGCQESGVASCAKYFPTEPDDTLAELLPDVIQPFRSVIGQGTIAIQCAPLSTSQLHKDPAINTLREQRYNYLRGQLGFDGLVLSQFTCTSDMDMGQNLDDMFAAFELGIDMLILPETDDDSIPLLDALRTAITAKDIDVADIAPSTSRLIEIKNRLGIQNTSVSFSAGSIGGIGLPEYYRTASDIADNSVTLLRNERNILPLDPSSSVLSLVFLDASSSLFATQYAEYLEHMALNTRTIDIFGTADDRIVYEILRRTREADSVICSFFLKPDSSYPNPAIISLMKQIIQANSQVVIASYYDPYLITRLPATPGYLNAYSPANASMQAAIEVMFGIKQSHGLLPIHVSDEFPIGSGITIATGDATE